MAVPQRAGDGKKDGAMFDQMTTVKAFGAVLVAALVFLLGQQFASGLYSEPTRPADERDWAYLGWVLEEQAETAETAEPEPEMTFDVAFAAADPDLGERVFRQCQSCHRLEEGANMTGPYLYGVVGRPIAAAEGFSYSDAMMAHQGEVWTPETLSAYLAEPNAFAPGNAMGNAQAVRDVEDRANLIAYLEQVAAD
jgi:cytochrome c